MLYLSEEGQIVSRCFFPPAPVSAAMTGKASTIAAIPAAATSKHKPVNSQDMAHLSMGINQLGFSATSAID